MVGKMRWLQQRALAGVLEGKRVLVVGANGNYLDIKLADFALDYRKMLSAGLGVPPELLGIPNPSQKLLAQHSTCPCPTCGGSREIIGDFGEELLPCPYCVTLERPFITTRETIIIAGWGESASAISQRLLANFNQAIEEVWAPRAKKPKTLSDSQFIESRRRYIK